MCIRDSHHAVLPGFLGGIDDFPEFLDGDGQGDFHKGVGAQDVYKRQAPFRGSLDGKLVGLHGE